MTGDEEGPDVGNEEGPDLKTIIRLSLSSSADGLRRRAAELDDARRYLNLVHMQKARFYIKLRNQWEHEGGKSTKGVYEGDVERAILAAEAEFMELNNRSDVPATYSVSIKLGNVDWPIHEAHWKRYTQRERK
ncbi:hypothetical protein KY362_04400 [Candidatus Woesearchaeota archaeon]|nr:hypothetical protein [Candidatus Woesearchaeota archaeon]